MKMTKKEHFEKILAYSALDESDKEFLKGELKLLANKSAYKSKKSLEKHKEDELICEKAVEILETKGALSCTNLANEMGLSSQKVRHAIKDAIANGTLVNYKEKGISFFKLAEVGE